MEVISDTGQRVPLHMGANTVGRAPDNDIVLYNGPLSRHHAELRWDGQQCLVVDLASTNGTFLDGRRLPAHKPEPWPVGAQLQLGPAATLNLVEGKGRPVGWAESRPAAPGLLARGLNAALDARKLAVGIAGLLAAGLLAAIFWLLSQALESAILAVILGLVALVGLWIILTLATATISRLAYIEIAEERREEMGQAFRHTVQHLASYLLSPLILVIGLLVVLAVEAALLLVGRVEYVGELLVSLAFLPLVLFNLILLIGTGFGLALTYPAVADAGGGIRQTLARVLAIVRHEPGRLAAYMILSGLGALLAFLIGFYLVATALYITAGLAGAGMGPKFAYVFFPLGVGGLVPDFFTLGSFSHYGSQATTDIARFLFGLAAFVLLALLLAVPQVSYLAGTCAAYLGLRPEESNPGAGPGRGKAAGSGEAPMSRKTCRRCGALLAYDQSYCPHCGEMQR